MDKDKLVFFTIYDAKGSPMRDQCNDSYSLGDAKEDLEQFLDNNKGVFRVEFRKTKGNSPTTKNFSFTVDNQQELQRENSIGNTFAGYDQMGAMSSKDNEISTLRNQILADSIASMNKLHEMQMKMLRKELKSGDGDNAALMQAGISALTSMFGGQSVGVSGLGSIEGLTEVKENNNNKTMDQEKIKINIAVVILMKNDPNFAEHITALANLCENNSIVYNMAISKLKDL